MRCCRGGQPAGLERIERVAALGGVDGAVAAGARAGVAHDLERRGAAPPALADVRAARLLADRVQALGAHDAVELVVARAGRAQAHAHPRRPLVRELSPRHARSLERSRAEPRPVSARASLAARSARRGCRRDRRSRRSGPASESLTWPMSWTPRPTISPTKPSKSSTSMRTRTPACSKKLRPRSRGLAPPSTRSSRPSRRAQKPSSSCSSVMPRDVP